jgi:hypothetical protein
MNSILDSTQALTLPEYNLNMQIEISDTTANEPSPLQPHIDRLILTAKLDSILSTILIILEYLFTYSNGWKDYTTWSILGALLLLSLAGASALTSRI